MNRKVFLGDSVYAAFDGHYVILTVENGHNDFSDRIYLNSEVLDELEAYRNENKI